MEAIYQSFERTIDTDMKQIQNIEKNQKKWNAHNGESNGLIEAIEIKNHPFFLAVQFHPEFTSRLKSPNPTILAFVKKTLNEN